MDKENIFISEKDIFGRIVLGLTVAEISSELNLSEYRLKRYIKQSIKNFEAKNRIHCVYKLAKLGII